MMKNVGIIIESVRGEIKQANYGMVTMAGGHEVNPGIDNDTRLTAFVIDADAMAVKDDLESYGITRIVHVSLAKEYKDNPDVRAKALINAIKEYDIHALFGLSTAMGKDLLPRIAALIDAPLVMDCQGVDLENGLAVTSQYSGKTTARIKLKGQVPVFGIRPNSVEPVKVKALAEVTEFDGTKIAPKGLKVIKTGIEGKGLKMNLAEANLIIAGGRGLKKKENFTLLSRCAAKLNAGSGASRVAVDSGWVPYSMQVGQTGEKVSPAVYMAFGISGSVQHFAGMKTSGMVIAVNTDENAAIMANSDYFVVADATEIISELIKILEND